MNGLDILACANLPTVPDTDCTIAVVDNFSGDQKADILWRNSASGELYVWLMNGTKVAERGSLYTVPIDWQIVAVGDVYGEGMADVVWRNATTGEDYLWLIGGSFGYDGFSYSAILGSYLPAVADTNWQVQAR